MEYFCRAATPWVCAASLLFSCADSAGAAGEESDTQKQLRQLQQQNEMLQQQMRKQQELIDDLSRKVTKLQTSENQRHPEEDSPEAKAEDRADGRSPSSSGLTLGKIHLGGEGAVGFFHSQPQGQFPNSEFRVDEARLFVEAPVWGEVYLFSEINLFTREEGGPNLQAGELYLDAENLSRLWGQDRQLNLRLGRFDIPFGEEYLSRDAIDNPLVSHSLMDLWGVDEGVELYGSFNKLSYVVAVQNGGHNSLRDYNGDKSVAVRLALDPTSWLHVSVSGMRTGELDVQQDGVSELWLGPGLVYSLGSANTTVFEANLLQGDVHLKFPRTTLKASGGVLQYDDDDPLANNRREVYYYYVEGVQKLYRGLYSAARWSQIFANRGFPVAGIGDPNTYAFGSHLAENLWLLSLGLGYRFSDQLVLKAEYSFQRGEDIDGAKRKHEDLFAATAAFAF
jgi:hypothetical protein